MNNPQDALRQILPTVGWPSDAAADVTFTGGNDPVLPTPFRVGVAGAATVAAAGLAAARLWEQRTGRRQQVTVDLRQATASLRSGTYMKLGDGALPHARNRIMGFYPTKDGRWSYLHCNFPNHRAVALEGAGRAGGPRGGGQGRDGVECAGPRGGDHRQQGCGRHGAQRGGMGGPSAGPRHRLPAGDRDREDRRQPARAAARRRPAAARHPRRRHHARAGGTDLRPHAGRARRRGDEDHREPSAQSRLPGMGHRPRQALRPARPARAGGARHAARADPAGRRVLARLPAGQPRRARPVARGTRRAAARPRLCVAVGVRPCRAMGLAARLRHRRADGERHHGAPGRALPRRGGARPAVLSAVGDRLLHRLPDGGRRDGGAGAPRARGRQLAGAHLARPDRQVAGRSRPGARGVAEGRARRVHAGRARQLVDGEPDAVGPAAAPQAGRAALGDARPIGRGRRFR